jgi:3-deoxy-D-manno-octulosonate 8-phosphate phosphatase (KDO 8-P phosphatase)
MTRLQRLVPKLKRIKAIFLDVDGVLTDGSVIYGNGGLELKIFDSQDGFGIANAIQKGIRVGIITGRKSEVIKRRASELGVIDVYEGSLDKVAPLQEIMKLYSLAESEIAYVGDDILDLPVLTKVGFSAAPQNAVHEVKMRVDYVCKSQGGHGAVREVIDLILKAQNKL